MNIMKMKKAVRFSWITLILCCVSVNAAERPPAKSTAAQQYIQAALKACDQAESQLPQMTRVAEIVAARHMAGGLIGFARAVDMGGQGLEEELWGRSGQIMHVSFDRPWKKDRTEAEKANDVLIMGWSKGPKADDLQIMREFKAKKCYIVGFGPRKLPTLAEQIKLCDAWFDTDYGGDDRVVRLADGSRVGRVNLLSDALNAWPFMGEVISAFTRRGKMPTIAKAFLYEDGIEWWNRYFGKQQFHDDFRVAPIPAGQMGRAYLGQMRGYLRKFRNTQMPNVNKTVDLILQELHQGKKTVVAGMGHMVWAYSADPEALPWAVPAGQFGLLESVSPYSVEQYMKSTPEDALVLRIGYSGESGEDEKIFENKRQRVMLITSTNPRPEMRLAGDLLTHIDMGFPFGDAVVAIKGYPIRALPPSGVMQLVAYQAVNVEALERLARWRNLQKHRIGSR